jgi:hypothetical protein
MKSFLKRQSEVAVTKTLRPAKLKIFAVSGPATGHLGLNT